MAALVPTTPLQGSIDHSQFFILEDADILKLIRDAFGPEFARLKNAPPASEPSAAGSRATNNPSKSCQSPSRFLFGADYDELNRTLVSILALKWIMTDDYDSFTSSQAPRDKLRRESFAELRELFSNGLKSAADIFALLVATVVNDLGKDPSLEDDVAQITGRYLLGCNHDMVIYEAAKANMVPSLRLLDEIERKDVILGLHVGATLNIAQLAQAENVPGSLASLLIMKGNKHAFDLKILEQILDVAGAAGHVDTSGAKPMNEPVFQAFLSTRKALIDVVTGDCSLRAAYDKVLLDRQSFLQREGFRPLSIEIPQERALLRLLTMGRTSDITQAELFTDAFYALPEIVRQQLINGLNVNGYDDGKAVVPYYMPALFSEVLQDNVNDSMSAKNALIALMSFLARVVGDTKSNPGQPGRVVERNVIFARDVIRSEAFRADPHILDNVAIPMD